MMAPDQARRMALEALRREADAMAQDCLRTMNEYVFRHQRRNPLLDDRYTAAERLLDMIDEQLRAEQLADPEAPDYFGIFTCEAEARAAFGDR